MAHYCETATDCTISGIDDFYTSLCVADAGTLGAACEQRLVQAKERQNLQHPLARTTYARPALIKSRAWRSVHVHMHVLVYHLALASHGFALATCMLKLRQIRTHFFF